MSISKSQQGYRQRRPLKAGAHTLRELADLRRQGQSWDDIAAAWGMRPRAGSRDLRSDLRIEYEAVGSPGRPDRTGRRLTSEERTAYATAYWAAVERWLLDLPPICTHCPVHCRMEDGGS